MFKPGFPHIEDIHLSILADILAYGRDSRLYRRLILKERIATYISAFTDYPGERYTNLFMLYAIPAPGKSYRQVELSIIKELRKIKAEGVTRDELLRIKKKLQSDFIYTLRSNASLADRLSYYELITNDYRKLFQYYSMIHEVTNEDIQRTAKKYLKENKRMSAWLLKPES